jgi:hypothetical protein
MLISDCRFRGAGGAVDVTDFSLVDDDDVACGASTEVSEVRDKCCSTEVVDVDDDDVVASGASTEVSEVRDKLTEVVDDGGVYAGNKLRWVVVGVIAGSVRNSPL